MVVWAFTLKITATKLQQFDSTIQRKGVKWNSYIMMVFGAKNFTNVWYDSFKMYFMKNNHFYYIYLEVV